MATLDVGVDVTVKCSKCGRSLDVDNVAEKRGEFILSVAPCDDCMETANEAGFDRAQQD